MSKPTSASPDKFWKGFWPSIAVLAVVLGFLFRESFKTDFVHSANDGPLGLLMSKSLAVPAVLTGYWVDLSWVGVNGSTAPSSLTYLLLWLLGPVGPAQAAAHFVEMNAALLVGFWKFSRGAQGQTWAPTERAKAA